MKPGISGLFILFCFIFLTGGCDQTPYGSLPDYQKMSAAEIDDLIETGLTAWRTPGSIDAGASCSGCHAPDGFDLAFIDFNDFHVRRRGAMHVGGEHSELSASRIEDIVNMIHAIRVKYNITPEEPLEYRPFQPGRQALAEASVGNREAEFLTHLQESGFRFATVPVLSKEEAFLQKEEWVNVDPNQIRIGIPLVRWSEDPQYSQSDTPLADWLPALPVLPKPGKEQQWFSLQNDYLRSSSDTNLKAVFKRLDEFTYIPFDGIVASLMLQKYRAVMIAQHLFRKEAASNAFKNTAAAGKRSVLRVYGENPFLRVSGMAYQLRNEELNILGGNLIQRYQLEKNKDEQLAELQHSWYWLSWILDPALNYNLPFAEKSDTPDPIFLPGFTDDYPVHYTYLITKSAVDSAFLAHSGLTCFVEPVLPSVIISAGPLPSEEQEQILFIENTWRMALHIFLDQTDESSLESCPLDRGSYSPLAEQETVAKWHQTITEIEAGFKIFNSRNMDYNLELTKQVRDRLQTLKREK